MTIEQLLKCIQDQDAWLDSKTQAFTAFFNQADSAKALADLVEADRHDDLKLLIDFSWADKCKFCGPPEGQPDGPPEGH